MKCVTLHYKKRTKKSKYKTKVAKQKVCRKNLKYLWNVFWTKRNRTLSNESFDYDCYRYCDAQTYYYRKIFQSYSWWGNTIWKNRSSVCETHQLVVQRLRNKTRNAFDRIRQQYREQVTLLTKAIQHIIISTKKNNTSIL